MYTDVTGSVPVLGRGSLGHGGGRERVRAVACGPERGHGRHRLRRQKQRARRDARSAASGAGDGGTSPAAVIDDDGRCPIGWVVGGGGTME